MSRKARGVLVRLVVAVMAAALVGCVGAQSTPVVTLNTNRLDVGGTLALDATFLRPDAPYTFTLVAPDGATTTKDVSSDAAGRLRVTAEVTTAGGWSASLSGPDIEASFRVNVLPPAGTPEEATPPARTPLPTAPLPETPPSTNATPSTENPAELRGGSVEPPSGSTEQPSDAGAPEAPSTDVTPPANATPDAGATPEGSTGDTLSPGGSPAEAGARPGAAASTDGERVTASLEDGTVVARVGGADRWRLDFPPGSGPTVNPIVVGEVVYVGHGNSLLAIDAGSGVVAQRYALPAVVADVALDGSAIAITVRYLDGSMGRLVLAPGGLSTTVRFDADPALFPLLRREAVGVDPATRLAQDPTNPWLYVQLADGAATPAQAEVSFRDAVDHVATFYDAAQLARVLRAAGQDDLAREAMDIALKDFAARGYRPELLTDRTLREAYGFPLSLMEAAVDKGDLATAGFWAPTVYALSTPAVPETQAALRDYAAALRTAARATGSTDQRNAASLWRSRADEGAGFRVGRLLDSVALSLGRNGWYAVAALLVAIVALHVTLLAKYWRPQSLVMRQGREAGRRASRVPRLFAARYYSLTEKVVLVLMFAAAFTLAAMAGWAQRSDAIPAALGSGTLASEPALSALGLDLKQVTGTGQSASDASAGATSPTEPGSFAPDRAASASNGSTEAARTSASGAAVAAFVRGYAAQTAGDLARAATLYAAAGDVPGALNNLGILKKDDGLLQRAVDVRPSDPVARFNLGRDADPSPFHAAFEPDVPLLAVPSPADLRIMLGGTVPAALAAAFTNPWTALTRTNPLVTPAWVWYVLVVLFFLFAAAAIVLLLAPRPRPARNAPRTLAYHVLALLLPGTGLADELWGVLLLVPWAIFGVDALLHLLPGTAAPTMPLQTDYTALGLIYTLNVVAFIVEFVSYRRRMRDLRHEFPDTARAYGMRVPPSAG